jgi:hypothetical protein
MLHNYWFGFLGRQLQLLGTMLLFCGLVVPGNFGEYYGQLRKSYGGHHTLL